MPAVKKRNPVKSDASVFDDANALAELVQRSFKKAAKEAVAENDRLGIPTHGTRRGKLTVRKSTKPVQR